VSHALEYYIADWNLAQFARALGKEADYQGFLAQSLRYREYVDRTDTRMIRPRLANGDFLESFNPRQGENFEPSPGFHEGNAYQYLFCVPHDVPGLIEMSGGEKAFAHRLQSIFDEGHFDMANEPDIHYPYLFNYVKGEEWRTQKELHRLMTTYFTTAAGGIPGNDDCGTLSTWIVFSMMGFYPVCPGDMNYALSSPVFDQLTIQLDERYYPGKELIIEAKRPNPASNQIRSMEWNGKKHRSYFLNHQEMVKGGRLVFHLRGER
jgi:predicted alpha-1,2-mannosidase